MTDSSFFWRFGIAISTPEIIAIFNKTKAPYNISTPTSEIAISALEPDGIAKMNANVDAIIQERANLIKSLKQLEGIGNIRGANDANFVLVEILDKQTRQPSNDVAFALYKQLAESNGIVVRFRGSELGCTGCLRITIGTPAENSTLVSKISALL